MFRIVCLIAILAAFTCTSFTAAQGPTSKVETKETDQNLEQPAVPNPLADPLETRIDRLLKQWSDRTAQIKSLYAEFDRTTEDPVWKDVKLHVGRARYLSPSLARLDIFEKSGNETGPITESYILTKKKMFHFRVALREIAVVELPPEMQARENLKEDGPLSFLLGTEPQKAKARYHLLILEENNEILRVQITPKLQEDQQQFKVCEITLRKSDFLLAKMAFIETTGLRVTYDFRGKEGLRIVTNRDKELPAKDFEPPDIDRLINHPDKDKRWRLVEHSAKEQKPGPREARRPPNEKLR